LAGSESEKSSYSDMDSDSDSDTVVGWKFLWKIKNQTLEKEKTYVFLLTIFILWHTGFRTHIKAIRGTI
jgi:hypothetical protein